MKIQTTKLEKISVKLTSDKGLVFKIYHELKLINKKTKFKNWHKI